MISSTDPRLTAYALGEMTDAERQAFEAELMHSDESRRHVAELSNAAELLRAELAQQSPVSLPAPHRARIESAVLVGDVAERAADGSRPDVSTQHAAPLGASPPGASSPGASAPGAATPSAVVLRPSFARRAAYVLAPLAVAAGVVGTLWTTNMSKEASSRSEEAPMAMPAETAGWDQAASSLAVHGTSSPAAAAPALPDRQSYEFGASPHGPPPVGGLRSVESPRPLAKNARSANKTKERDWAAKVDVAPTPPPENPFVEVTTDPKSTFSIDVDTASYSLARRLLEMGQRPDPNLIRIEEMVNYFTYSYPEPEDAAFGVHTDATTAPWASSHRLMRVGLKGKSVAKKARPASNLVFLVDASGSMEGADRIELLRKGFEMLVEQLDERDTVSIVVYAGAAGLVLPPTKGNEKRKILDALSNLKAGGSTNGGQGIQLAYETAKRGFLEGGTNRVILATDGDFNVGVSNRADLVKLIEDKAKTGVFLTVLGFGLGNTKDGTMEQLADKGNGNYAYIDGLSEARKVLVDQVAGTLQTIAKDVKIQITFDPKTVQSFRLIGYENRVLAHSDFNDDTKDAGDIGAGHTVTALYEVVTRADVGAEAHLADVALRYKQPDGVTSRLVETSVVDMGTAFEDASTDFRFAASVAGFGMLLRGSKHAGNLTFARVVEIANGSTGDDPDGYRKELVHLARSAQRLTEH